MRQIFIPSRNFNADLNVILISYFNGCDGTGADCKNLHYPDNFVADSSPEAPLLLAQQRFMFPLTPVYKLLARLTMFVIFIMFQQYANNMLTEG